MLLFFLNLLATCFLVVPVHAGSRLWELPIPQVRGNATEHTKRAVSIVPGSGPGDTRLWPDKTIIYAFADTKVSSKQKGLFFQGSESWSELKQHGFGYKEISASKCKSNRIDCLMVHFNDKGFLSSTVAKPALDATAPEYEGPTMHLSDSRAVGNLDPVINAAHEIGHAWGLYHEHQNFKWWKTSNEHGHGQTSWPQYTGEKFHTNKFHCENLKDYEAKLAKVMDGPNPEFDRALMCTSQPTAARYKFSAMEWLPVDLAQKKADADYDENSLMLYPSRAGGAGTATEGADNRQIVLTYADGKEIPLREGPSPMDISRLVDLYGSSSKAASEPYNKKGSRLENLFRKIRSDSNRAGDTEGGLC